MLLAVATRIEGAPVRLSLHAPDGTAQLDETGPVTCVRLAPQAKPLEFSLWMDRDGGSPVATTSKSPLPNRPGPRWPQVVTTRGTLSAAKDAFVVDEIPLPLENPWRRNVRLGDIQFFRDGRAAGVTIDGDVWLIDGLVGNLAQVRWRRFASGLHEPLALAIREEEIFVFDRNGLWRLRDADGDGEADAHELFCNLFAQTGDTREFPNAMKLAPDGSFVLAKGGQRGDTLAKDSGTVLRVSPDGRSVTTLGWGFRQPFVGVHPRTGFVTATDQEGNYVPATPIYALEQNEFHGFLAGFLPVEKYPAPIADPLVWLPHTFNSSAASQLWLVGARLGPLNDALLHFAYNRPELFVVRLSERTARPQPSVISVTRDWPSALLSGAVNPVDGQLYAAGFQIYAGSAERVSGLARLRHTGAESPLPREIVAMDQGVLLRFDVPLDPRRVADLASYRFARWNYKRTAKYGSPHLRLDGELGQEPLLPSSAYLSRDRRSVFVGIPGLRAGVMQMQVGWSLATAAGAKLDGEAMLTPYELAHFVPANDGFDDVAVDLTPRAIVGGEADHRVLTAADGGKLAEVFACVACHSTDGSKHVGPTWKGLPGSTRKFKGGGQAVADDGYLRESILFSSARIVEGSDEGMPAYAGILNDQQVAALILFIKSL
jgi:mono/diheme cytochrome c family protein